MEKTIIKNLVQKRWSQKHPDHNKDDSYYKLSRADQAIVFRLRTGHSRLNAHLFNKMRVGQSELCPCGTAAMTTEHFLQSCQLHNALRAAEWPVGESLNRKLFGDLAALTRTTSFVRKTGVPI